MTDAYQTSMRNFGPNKPTLEARSPQTAGTGMSGLTSPDLTPLNEWKKRVVEYLNTSISLYVEDTNHLPDAKTFTEMSWSALLNSTVKP